MTSPLPGSGVGRAKPLGIDIRPAYLGRDDECVRPVHEAEQPERDCQGQRSGIRSETQHHDERDRHDAAECPGCALPGRLVAAEGQNDLDAADEERPCRHPYGQHEGRDTGPKQRAQSSGERQQSEQKVAEPVPARSPRNARARSVPDIKNAQIANKMTNAPDRDVGPRYREQPDDEREYSTPQQRRRSGREHK
jgi:hypothetical protein